MGCKYENEIIIDDLIIKTKPLSYKQFTVLNLKNFELQQKLRQSDLLESKEDQQLLINELWVDLANTQKELYIASIESVQTPDITVSELGFIKEWIENCDKRIIDEIKKQIDNTRKKWNIPSFKVVCDCGTEANIAIDLDYSNFFVKA
jgi:hypothetical protein